MSRNIEIKAKLKNVYSCITKAEFLSGGGPEIIRQEDIFFYCGNGRMKLRIFSEIRGELIFYRRPDRTGPKMCEYYITRTNEPRKLRDVLEKAYGSAGAVKKTRHLYMAGRTRIHIDKVEGLGDFIELEVVLSEQENGDDGMEEAQKLMKELEIESNDLINRAYFDLLRDKKR